MNNELSWWQRKMADWGRPNDNGGSNYSDAELQYYLRDILKNYNDFIPTPVLRDAWTGTSINYAQPAVGTTPRYPTQEEFNNILRKAIDTRIALRDNPWVKNSPTGANIDEMWGATLSPTDAILQQIKLDQYQGSGRGDYYPPID